MSQKFTSIFTVFLLLLSFSLLGKDFNQHRATEVTPEDDARFIERLQDISSTPVPTIESQVRQELGRTWYDFPANNVTGRMLAYALDSQDGQDGIHFTFMKILPQGAERFVTYDYFDLNLNIFFGNASIDESLGRSGWGTVTNGRDDEVLVTFHSNTLGGIHLYQDAAEAGYTFSETVGYISPDGAVFPGLGRMGDNVIFMGQKDNVASSWVDVDTIMVSTDYMQTWTGSNAPEPDPNASEWGPAEVSPWFNPTNSNEISWVFGPDVTANAPDGEVVMITSPDLTQSYMDPVGIVNDSEILPNGKQYIVENFNQFNYLYTQDGNFHVVIGAVQGVLDTSSALIDLFPILYWNSNDSTLIELTSDAADTPTDTATINGLADFRPGNGLGNAYPHISTGPNGDLFVIWQQWEDDGSGGLVTVVPTGGGETFLTDIWGAYSPDGGQTWSDPMFIAGTPGESDVYPNMTSSFSYNTAGDSILLDIIYMHDTNPNVSLSNFPNPSDPSEVIWYYDRISLPLPVGIGDETPNVANSFTLEQNYPNPFNPTTRIDFTLAKSAKVSLKVYNALGQKVATLVNGKMTAGEHSVNFDASNLTSGLYFYKLSDGKLNETRKMVLLK